MNKYKVTIEYPVYESTNTGNQFSNVARRIKDKQDFLNQNNKANQLVVDSSKKYVQDLLDSVLKEMIDAGLDARVTVPFSHGGSTWASLLLDDDYYAGKRGVHLNVNLHREYSVVMGERVYNYTGDFNVSVKYYNQQEGLTILRSKQQLVDMMLECIKV